MFGKKKGDDYYKTHMTEEEIAEATLKMEEKKAERKNKEKRGVKDVINDTMIDTMDRTAMMVRQKYYPRWRKMCNVETDAEIDFDHPVVSTEYFLCDPRIQRALMQGNRDSVLAKMNETQR